MNASHHRLDFSRLRFHRFQIGAEQLDGIFAFYAGHRFFHIVLNHLGEIKNDAGNDLEAFFDFLHQLIFGESRPPVLMWFEIGQKFRIEKTGGIGAVVGSAELRDDRDDFRRFPEHLPDFSGQSSRFVERNIHRHGGPHPEVPFLQCGHEFPADELQGTERRHQQQQRSTDDLHIVSQRPSQDGQVRPANRADETRVLFRHHTGQEQRAQDRS